MSGEGLFRWWDLIFLGFAITAGLSVQKWRGEVIKDKRAGHEFLADGSRNIVWEEVRALLMVLGLWIATIAYRVLF